MNPVEMEQAISDLDEQPFDAQEFQFAFLTVTPDIRFEVSRRIREEFESGKHYYALQGQQIIVSDNVGQRPDSGSLSWHNEHCFKE